MTHFDQPLAETEDVRNTAEYDQWLRAKVQAALDDPRPSIPHEEAMRMVRASLEEAIRRKAAREASANSETDTN